MRRLTSHGFLFEQMVRRELRQKYKGTALGVAWYLVNPLVLMGAYYLLFGVVFRFASYEDYPLFLMVGLVVWIFFSQSLLSAAPCLLDHGALIRKARFPRATIPASVVAVQAVIFASVLAVVAVVVLAIRGTLDPALLVLPYVLLCLVGFTTGLALVVAALHAFFRDVAPIVSAALLPWFFLSPIFYAVDTIVRDDAARFALEWLNPVAPFIEGVRAILYAGEVPSGAVLAYVAVAAVAALLVGRLVFRRLEPELAVVV